MNRKLLWFSIGLKTRSCLIKNRLRGKPVRSFISRMSNLLFALLTLALMATVVHEVFQLPVTVTLETKILAGETMSGDNVPVIAEAVQMRFEALEQEKEILQEREIEHYMEKFSLDRSLARSIYDISLDEKLEPELIFGIIWKESRFNPNAVGKIGEIGLMQVRYGTALCVDPGATRKKLFDPAYNIRIGIKHLKDHLHFYRGDKRLALLAYNRGRGKVNGLLKGGLSPANGYAASVLNKNF
ncbi:MAG: lytic transglycosylase domain-containing protein [Gemmatimonadota bacterium]|nr:lytic transglycosylase domain-containing protein [Gemmatimonadota bacterium]